MSLYDTLRCMVYDPAFLLRYPGEAHVALTVPLGVGAVYAVVVFVCLGF